MGRNPLEAGQKFNDIFAHDNTGAGFVAIPLKRGKSSTFSEDESYKAEPRSQSP